MMVLPVVLEPDLDLSGRQPDDAGQVLPLGGGQVPLLAEASLQLVGLRLREQHASLALLLRRLRRVGGVPGPLVVRLDVLLDAVAVGVHRHVVVVPAEVARRGGATAQGVHPGRVGLVAGAARGVGGRRAGRQHARRRRRCGVERPHAVAVEGRSAAASACGRRRAVGTELLRGGNQTRPAQT
jgi:hypothetical protein